MVNSIFRERNFSGRKMHRLEILGAMWDHPKRRGIAVFHKNASIQSCPLAMMNRRVLYR